MGRRKNLYIVEDDIDVRNLLRTVLEEHGFAVSTFGSGEAVRSAIRREPPDLCVIDLGLPDIDGLTLIRELWEDIRFGVVVVTGRGDLTDRVLGLELGADDYIVKPFEPRELVARVKTVIRRHDQLVSSTSVDQTKRARFADWVVDMSTLTLTADSGKQENLTAAEASLLLSLLRAPRRVLSRDQLRGTDDDRDDQPFDRAIDVRISRIRKKIEPDPRTPRLIKTVYGAGYLFNAEVTWLK